MKKKPVLFILAGVLAAEIVTLLWWTKPPVAGPSVGGTLPEDVVIERLPERDTLDLQAATAGRCGLVYVMSTHCPFCNRMRATWRIEYPPWAGRVGRRVAVTWLLDAGAAETLRWVAGWDLPSVTVATLVSDRDEAWRRLGVTGTPISYVTRADGSVAAGVAGPGLPPPEVVAGACGMDGQPAAP